MGKIFLVRDFDNSFDYSGKEIVALDPVVAYYLDKRNIPYTIAENYYAERDMASIEKEYFFEQLEQFKAFDDFLKDNISYCKKYDIPLAMANYLRLKYVIDTFVIYAYIISRIIEKCAVGKEVVYMDGIAADGKGSYSPFSFKRRSREAFSNVLKIACEKYNVKFTEMFMIKDRALSVEKQDRYSLFYLVKNSFIKGHLKKMLNFFKYQRFNMLFPVQEPLKGLNIFVMHAGSLWIDHPIKELIKNRANVYLAKKDSAIKEGSFFRAKLSFPQLEESFAENLRIECDQCSEKLDSSPLLEWVDTKCGMDISKVIVPFLKYFIKEDCPYILLDTEKKRRFYKTNNIQYLIARANTEKDSMGNILAARYCRGAKSVCIQHACFTQDIEFAGVNDTEVYDYLITAEDITHGFYDNFLKTEYSAGCRLISSPHYLQQIRKRYDRKRKIRNGREKVVYVVSKFSNGVRSFNNMTYPLTWYYEFQKKLIDLFAAETQFDFIYKHAPRLGQEWADLTIIKYIEEGKIRNISVSREHFLKYLELADRIIVDNPSTTALFESAAAGKPVLALYPDWLDNILADGKAVFGKILRPFSTFEEAAVITKEFLHGDPASYTVKIPLGDRGFINAFRELVGK